MNTPRHSKRGPAWWRSVCVLRRDGRASLTQVSRETGLPISTLWHRLQAWPGVRRATLLLDFAKLGAVHVWLLVGGVPRTALSDLEAFFVGHPAVNTVQRLMTEATFLVELVLPQACAIDPVLDALHVEFQAREVQVLYVSADVQREGYLTDPLRYPHLTGVLPVEPVRKEVAR